MKSLKDALPDLPDPGPIPADELCPRCGYHGEHDCCECRAGGRVRVRLSVHDPHFGRSIPCPSCHGKPEYSGPTFDEWVRRARIPARFQNATFNTWEPLKYTGQGDPRARASEWIAAWPPEKPLLALFGTRGTGKTHLAVSTLRVAFESLEIVGLMWNCADLMARYRATMSSEPSETEHDIDRELDMSLLLVLDDYGAQQETKWAQSKLYGVINRRYESTKPLIVTSNATLQDDRTVSRLVDRQSTLAVLFDGKDVREA